MKHRDPDLDKFLGKIKSTEYVHGIRNFDSQESVSREMAKYKLRFNESVGSVVGKGWR
jgi:hypothetical protein